MNTNLTRAQKIKEKRLASFDAKARFNPPVFKDIRDLLDYIAKTYTDKPVYIFKRDNKEITYSFKEYVQLVYNIGTGFSKLGINGKTTVVIGETCVEYMATYQAVVINNGVIVPIDRELPIESIVDFVNQCGAEVIVYASSANGKLTPVADQMPNVKYFIPVFPTGENCENAKIIPISEVIELGKQAIANGDNSFATSELNMKDMRVLLYTSGTTGTAKGVMLSHHNLISAINSSIQSTEYDDSSLFLDLLPVHHSYEMTCSQFGIIACGGTMYINDSVKNTIKNIKYVKPKDIVVVPLYLETIRKRIWHEIDKKGMRNKVVAAMKLSEKLQLLGIDVRNKLFAQIREGLGGNVRSFVVGAAPVDPEILYEFDRFGMTVHEGYGITECAPLVAVNRWGNRRFGSVGFPVPGVDVKIDKAEDEEVGEILVKGDNVMMGYYKNEEATKEVFTEDGYFKTGDLGCFDEDGYLYLKGRKKNLILLSNGKNVFPEELEERLGRKEIVAENVVVLRNIDGIEKITAIVYPNQDLIKGKNSEEVLDMVKNAVNEVNKELAIYKHINNIEIRDIEFEKTTTRKIKRFLVK